MKQSNLRKWFNENIRKYFWWRVLYRKETFSPGWYGAKCKCLHCHAGFRVNSTDSYPVCSDPNNICPCKGNETLKFRN